MDALLARVDAEVAGKRLWRAKEIIRGNIANAWPHPEVVERYGQVLLDMGDELEAGKYLWLSGVRIKQYEKPVALFLSRHGRHGAKNLLAQLPKTLKRVEFDQLPTEVQRDLTRLGGRRSDFGVKRRSRPVLPRNRWLKDSIFGAVGIGFLVCLIVGVGVGFRAIVMWVVQLFR
jgi:uncharacterized protein DUF6584